MKYKIIEDLTSDVMFESYGKNLKEIFENSAIALFKIMCQIEKVSPKKSIIITLKGKTEEELMYSWLQKLIALVDIKEMFFSRFKIVKITKKELKAKIYGEEISPEKGNVVIKAITNHKFLFKKTKKGYFNRVVLDI